MPTTTNALILSVVQIDKKGRKAMIDMTTVHNIRLKRKRGESVSQIAREEGVSRGTVYKYLADDADLSPKPPSKTGSRSRLDPYREIIRSWLEEDKKGWKKQRHTAHRIWVRLAEECNVSVGESTVRRYVAELKKEVYGSQEQFLDLVWAPGEAQCDFGEADFYLNGIRTRLFFLVLVFPFSNVAFTQLFFSQCAVCVCEGLKSIFGHIGGVPARIVFDNAAGVGRKTCSEVHTSKLFASFAAHYGFDFSFCNPYSGHEKGTVENKVGFIRRNLFVPVKSLHNVEHYNKKLMIRSEKLSDKLHWRKNENELQLFMEDRLALTGLPQTAFDVVDYHVCRADKYGKVVVGGPHRYSTDPSFARSKMIVGLRAFSITVYDEHGTEVVTHERRWRDVPTDNTNPASQLALLARKPGAWQNSLVRAEITADLRDWMDGLDKKELGSQLRILRNAVAVYGWDDTVAAASLAFRSTGSVDEASLCIAAASANVSSVVYDEAVDLSIYDAAVMAQGGR